MAYQALYRQWRPLNFNEIVGQDHITQPIKNQIVTKSFGHAYIFSGTRGTGKTSTAKVFARAVNCLNNTDGNPCNTCENCKSILEDQFIDVIEMDAASNNSVDDIRELREHVKFAPSKGKYKVYIIDEVHMLSTGAFNALLKTLEEPPEYVLFILATTEPQKIPQTIISRCQKYDFKRVSFEQIFQRIKYICEQLGIEYEEEAIKLIIEKSDGAVRDSLSQLDQCLSIHENTLKVMDVINLLGLVEKNQIMDLIHFIAERKMSEAFQMLDEVMKNGKDLVQFANAIIGVYRDLLITKVVKENHHLLINASNEYIEALIVISKQFTESQVSRGLNLFMTLSKEIKYAQNKRTLFEATMMKVMSPQTEVSLEALMERVDQLERKVARLSREGLPQSVPKNSPQEVYQNETVSVTSVSQEEEKQPKNEDRQEAPKAESVPIRDSEEGIESFVEFTDKTVTLEDVNHHWDAFMDTVKNEKKGIYPSLEGAIPIQFNGDKIVIQLKRENKLFINLLSNTNNSRYFNRLMSNYLKKSVSLEFIVDDQPAKAGDNDDMIKDFFQGFSDKLEIK